MFPARSAAWTCAAVACAVLAAAAVFALAPGAPGPASAATLCNPATKQRTQRALGSFERAMTARRRAYFRTHPRAKARRRFVRRQRARLGALGRAAVRCAHPIAERGHGSAVAESTDPAPPPCSPRLFAAPGAEMNEANFASALSLAATGTLPAVVLFVDFPDLRASGSTSPLYDSLARNSRTWMSEVSYGRAALEMTPVHRWYRMPRGFRAYGLGDGVSFDEQRDYIAEAVAAADADVDFSPFRIIFVVAARGSNLERSPAFHAFRGNGVPVDGTELRYGATFGEDIHGGDPRYPSNVLLHELGHILGLPDLYDVPNPVFWGLLRFAGGWDMMSWNSPGAHFLAWHKWKLGWLDPTQLTCLTEPGERTVRLTPLSRAGGLKAVVVPTGPSTAYVVEARTRTGQDAHLCEEGVLVYAVDANVRSGNGPVRVRAAAPGRNPDRINRCGPLYDAPFDTGRGEVARFQDASAGLTMQVLGSGPGGYRVRVARTSSATSAFQIRRIEDDQGHTEHVDPPLPPSFHTSFRFDFGWAFA